MSKVMYMDKEYTGQKIVDSSVIIDTFYPVGSYYETSDTTFNPNTAWGGTWVLMDSGMINGNLQTYYTDGYTGSTAITTTSTRDIATTDFTTKTGKFLIIADCALQTSKNTSRMNISVNGTVYSSAYTNMTTQQQRIATYIYPGTKNTTYSIKMLIGSQDTSTTATIPVYTNWHFIIIDIPQEEGCCWHRTA